MKTILNVIWLVLCGIWMSIAWALAGLLCFILFFLVITIPFGIAAFRIANYVLWPFGRTIAPREGGPLEIVVDGETGSLIPPRDPIALASAIDRLVADPELRRRMGAAARARVDAVFDIRQHVRAMEAVFDEMLATRRSS